MGYCAALDPDTWVICEYCDYEGNPATDTCDCCPEGCGDILQEDGLCPTCDAQEIYDNTAWRLWETIEVRTFTLDGEPLNMGDFMDWNQEIPLEDLRAIAALNPAESFVLGGGAAAEFTITRIN
jgi:hypothetical protein